MLLYVLESVLKGLDLASAKRCVFSFFTEFNDNDLTALLKREADGKAREMLERLSRGHVLPLAQRFDHRSLPPESRMALSTVARHGRMKQIFESCIMRDHGALADLSTGSGVPKSARTAYGFLYDESALAAGLIRSLTRQITLSLFSDTAVEISKADLDRLAGRILRFIRIEDYMPTDGLLLIFHSLHKMLSNSFGERILVPRIRNITWIYRTVQSLSSKSSESGLRGLYDYNFHEDYGFPYSERLFEDIQILVAMGMVYQDLRQVEVAGRWIQRYEYMLTREGLAYSEVIAKAYPAEAEFISQALRMDRHSIPYDMVSMLSKAK
jgi:hypothetical protein